MIEKDKMLSSEDLLVIGFDNAPNGDCAALSVARIRNNKIEIINMFYDEDAIEMYERLTNW